jgi:hypothetical protein
MKREHEAKYFLEEAHGNIFKKMNCFIFIKLKLKAKHIYR